MLIFRDSSVREKATEPPDGFLTQSVAIKTTLEDLRIGTTAHIVNFSDDNAVIKKIEAMGLRRGEKVTIMLKLGRGLLVKTNNSRIVITSDVAKDVEVK